MSVRNFTLNKLMDQQSLLSREEQLARSRASADSKNTSALLSLIPTLLQGGLSAAQLASSLQDADLDKLTKLASLSTAGEEGVPVEVQDELGAALQVMEAPVKSASQKAGSPLLTPTGTSRIGTNLSSSAEAPPAEVANMQKKLDFLSKLGVRDEAQQKEADALEATLAGVRPITEDVERPASADARQGRVLPPTGVSGAAVAAQKQLAAKSDEVKPAASPAIQPTQAGVPSSTGTTDAAKAETGWIKPTYKLTPRQQAERDLAEALKSNKPNLLQNLLTLGSAEGKYDTAKALALKVAESNVIKARQEVEQKSFDRYIKLNKSSDNPELTQARIDLLQAQAKAADARATGLNIKTQLKSDDAESLIQQDQAINKVDKVRNLATGLIKSKQSVPVSTGKQLLAGMLKAAGSDIDPASITVSSSTGVVTGKDARGNVIVLSGGVSEGTNSGTTSSSTTGGGKKIDEEVLVQALEELDTAKMTPEQRRYVRQSLQTIQQIGKAREGGKLTDKDLAFYMTALLGNQSPQDLFESLDDIEDDLEFGYSKTYKSLESKHPEDIKSFTAPSSRTRTRVTARTFNPTASEDDPIDWKSINAANEAAERARMGLDSGFGTGTTTGAVRGRDAASTATGMATTAGKTTPAAASPSAQQKGSQPPTAPTQAPKYSFEKKTSGMIIVKDASGKVIATVTPANAERDYGYVRGK